MLSARDENNNRMSIARELVVVAQGQAGTLGPNGSPADDATFTVIASFDYSSSKANKRIL